MEKKAGKLCAGPITQEELMLKEKYKKLRKLKSALKECKKEQGNPRTRKYMQYSAEAQRAACELVKSGVIPAIRKDGREERTTFKRAKRANKNLRAQDSLKTDSAVPKPINNEGVLGPISYLKSLTYKRFVSGGKASQDHKSFDELPQTSSQARKSLKNNNTVKNTINNEEMLNTNSSGNLRSYRKIGTGNKVPHGHMTFDELLETSSQALKLRKIYNSVENPINKGEVVGTMSPLKSLAYKSLVSTTKTSQNYESFDELPNTSSQAQKLLKSDNSVEIYINNEEMLDNISSGNKLSYQSIGSGSKASQDYISFKDLPETSKRARNSLQTDNAVEKTVTIGEMSENKISLWKKSFGAGSNTLQSFDELHETIRRARNSLKTNNAVENTINNEEMLDNISSRNMFSYKSIGSGIKASQDYISFNDLPETSTRARDSFKTNSALEKTIINEEMSEIKKWRLKKNFGVVSSTLQSFNEQPKTGLRAWNLLNTNKAVQKPINNVCGTTTSSLKSISYERFFKQDNKDSQENITLPETTSRAPNQIKTDSTVENIINTENISNTNNSSFEMRTKASQENIAFAKPNETGKSKALEMWASIAASNTEYDDEMDKRDMVEYD